MLLYLFVYGSLLNFIMYSSKGQETKSADASKTTKSTHEPDKYASIPTQSSSAPMNNYDDEFDDFDPRGTSSASKYWAMDVCLNFLELPL